MEEDLKILEEFIRNYKEVQEKYKDDEIQAEIERSCYFEEVPAQAIENLIKGYKEHRNALIDMVNQFADTDKEEKHLYTMGLSALENAFSILDIDKGIKREDLWKLQEGDTNETKM